MTAYARKITQSKWSGAEWASQDRIPADALTSDLRARSNTLSFWWCVREDGTLDEDAAVLAILGTMEDFEKIDIAFVPAGDMAALPSKQTPGRTWAVFAKDMHVDIVDVDHSTFIKAAAAVAAQVYNSGIRRFTASDLKKRLSLAIAAGTVQKEEVPPKMLEALATFKVATA